MARRGTPGTAKPQEENTNASPVLAAPASPAPRGNGGASAGEQNRISQSAANVSFSSDEIAHRAYQIYEREGRMDGRDMDHWLQAERELREERERAGRSNQQDLRDPEGNGNQGRGAATRPQRADEAPRSARRHQASMA